MVVPDLTISIPAGFRNLSGQSQSRMQIWGEIVLGSQKNT